MISNIPLVWGFNRPHRVGSLCGNPCEQCGHAKVMTGPGNIGRLAVPLPLLIVREATFEEYAASVISNGGRSRDLSRDRFFYVVTLD